MFDFVFIFLAAFIISTLRWPLDLSVDFNNNKKKNKLTNNHNFCKHSKSDLFFSLYFGIFHVTTIFFNNLTVFISNFAAFS